MRSPRSWEAMPPPSTAARDFLRRERQATRSGQDIANVKADTGPCGTAVIHVVRPYGVMAGVGSRRGAPLTPDIEDPEAGLVGIAPDQ